MLTVFAITGAKTSLGLIIIFVFPLSDAYVDSTGARGMAMVDGVAQFKYAYRVN